MCWIQTAYYLGMAMAAVANVTLAYLSYRILKHRLRHIDHAARKATEDKDASAGAYRPG